MGNERSLLSSTGITQKNNEVGDNDNNKDKLIRSKDVCRAIHSMESENGSSFKEIKDYLLNNQKGLYGVPGNKLDNAVKQAMIKSLNHGYISRCRGFLRYKVSRGQIARRGRSDRSVITRSRKPRTTGSQSQSKSRASSKGKRQSRRRSRSAKKRSQQRKKSVSRSGTRQSRSARGKRTKKEAKKAAVARSSGSYQWFWDRLMGAGSSKRSKRKQKHKSRR